MPTKRLESLMFVQGGNCFFCKSALAKADASIEHLLPAPTAAAIMKKTALPAANR
jgi:hypothetical protein